MDNATTRGAADMGGLTTAQDVGEKLNKMQVGRRTTQNVGAALNEQPNPPSDPRAKRVRSEMQRNERGGYWEGIIASDFADLTDGVPVEVVLATHEVAIAAIKARAPQTIRLDRPLTTYMRAEMSEEHRLNLVQEAAVANPECPETLEKVAQRGRGYLAVLREMIDFCDERSVVLRGGQGRRVYGARRTASR